jgi:hypothetical protein
MYDFKAEVHLCPMFKQASSVVPVLCSSDPSQPDLLIECCYESSVHIVFDCLQSSTAVATVIAAAATYVVVAMSTATAAFTQVDSFEH